ncbi:hypothetical protein DsansV1_C04g0047881 [Dioscorea sansibarensis]
MPETASPVLDDLANGGAPPSLRLYRWILRRQFKVFPQITLHRNPRQTSK